MLLHFLCLRRSLLSFESFWKTPHRNFTFSFFKYPSLRISLGYSPEGLLALTPSASPKSLAQHLVLRFKEVENQAFLKPYSFGTLRQLLLEVPSDNNHWRAFAFSSSLWERRSWDPRFPLATYFSKVKADSLLHSRFVALTTTVAVQYHVIDFEPRNFSTFAVYYGPLAYYKSVLQVLLSKSTVFPLLTFFALKKTLARPFQKLLSGFYQQAFIVLFSKVWAFEKCGRMHNLSYQLWTQNLHEYSRG